MSKTADSGPQDIEGLANRFLDLWQAQFAAMAADPALAEGVVRLLKTMGAAWAGPMAAAAGGAARGSGATESEGDGAVAGQTGETADAAAGAPAAASPSVDGGGKLDELVRRVAALEKRLDELESRSRRTGGGTSGSRPKRRSG